MTLADFKSTPWRASHRSYEKSALAISPAPEYASSEVLVSSLYRTVGFSTLKAKVPWGPAFLAPVAARVRREAGLPVAAAWGIDNPAIADACVRDGQLDLVMVGRAHLANPHWPMHAARALGVERPTWVLPAPYAHWLERYAGA